MTKKTILLTFLLSLLTTGILCAGTAENSMNDALARGYKSITEKKLDQSKEWFNKSKKYAIEAKNWRGLLDSGYGLSTLGFPKEAADCFNEAEKILLSGEDWHGCVALGYAYSSLPDNLGLINRAPLMWEKAKELSNTNEDLYGLIESGRGFMSIEKNSGAESCFDNAKILLEKYPTQEGIKTLVEAYRALGNEKKAAECARLSSNTGSDFPPGWHPTVGETVRKPKTVPIEVQETQRMSADRDIEAKQNWEQQQAEIKSREKIEKQRMAYEIYRDYLCYYSYPYYGSYSGFIGNYDDYYIYSWSDRPVWAARTYPEMYNWACWNFGRYAFVDGVYIAIDID